MLPVWQHVQLLTLVAAGFLALRIWPIWPSRHQGCDAYNILLNAEALRARPRLPIRVPPLFMLEEQDQWYPPGFLILCALIPQRILERFYWLLNHVVDFGSSLLIYAGAIWLGGDVWLAACLALTYAIMPSLVTEFSALNVRPFGLLLCNALMLANFAFVTDPKWQSGLIVGVLALCLFYSHKLSAQQLWFTLPVLALWFAEPLWLAPLIAMYILPFAVWPRGAWRVLRGHGVIVRFWHRNWNRLGAHMVRQSPVYGDGKTRTDFFADESPQAYLRFAKDMLHQNYFVLPVIGAASTGALPFAGPTAFLIVWIGSVYLWGVAIHCLPPLRGIGLGRQYFKFALVPSLIATALALSATPADPVAWTLAAAALALTVRQYVMIARNLRAESGGSVGRISPDLDAALAYIAETPEMRILALPIHLGDLVAYRSRRPVYWGTHSDVFDDRLEAFFPVMHHPLGHYAADGATHLLLDTRYARPEELELSAARSEFEAGPFRLFKLEPTAA